MGLTLHGIKYPEMPDIPNVPDDIGGLAKLDQTTQAWLASLDTANLSKLSAMNIRCATTEGTTGALSANTTTAVNRQSSQQVTVASFTTRNDSVTTRLNVRDVTLAADQSAVLGFPGQIASLNTTKGRGLVGYVSANTNTNVHQGGDVVPFAHFTFNDPSPSVNRAYRVLASVTLSIPTGSAATTLTVGCVRAPGTTFPGWAVPSNVPVDQSFNGTYGYINSVFLDLSFTGITDSQWTVWIYASSAGAFDYIAGAGLGDFMTLEDTGFVL